MPTASPPRPIPLRRCQPPLMHTFWPCETVPATPKVVVSKRIPQPRTELSPRVREHEARLLAVMLRTSRLTWVFGDAGTDSATLLKAGVMPLLQRRSGDRLTDASPERPAVPDRRRQAADERVGPRREAVIHFDTWGESPLSQLKRSIDRIVPAGTGVTRVPNRGSLSNDLLRLKQGLGLHVVFVLSRFEEYLALSRDEDEVAQFANEWVDSVVNQELWVNFLVTMDEAARPLLERFRALLPGFDDNALRLAPVSNPLSSPPEPWPSIVQIESVPGGTHLAETPSSLRINVPAVEPPRRSAPSRRPIGVNDVYALIESTLTRTATGEQPAPRFAGVDIDLSAPTSQASAPIVAGVARDRGLVSGKFRSRR